MQLNLLISLHIPFAYIKYTREKIKKAERLNIKQDKNIQCSKIKDKEWLPKRGLFQNIPNIQLE